MASPTKADLQAECSWLRKENAALSAANAALRDDSIEGLARRLITRLLLSDRKLFLADNFRGQMSEEFLVANDMWQVAIRKRSRDGAVGPWSDLDAAVKAAEAASEQE